MHTHNRSISILSLLASFAVVLAQAPAALAQNKHTLPLVMAASDAQYGYIRVINNSAQAGTVRIHAIDDSGQRRGPVTLSLAASATVNFSSYDLEGGGAGLSGGVGDSTGHWRLELETDLDIEPVAYVRTSDGFLASVHDVIEGASMRWHVVYFNPGSNIDKVSLLRVVNTSGIETEVVIEGRDDAGVSAPGGKVSFTLPAEGARMLSAQDLEGGYSASESAFEFEGSLGDGTGKWQLFVTAGRPVQVMSLLNVTLTGHLANLSTVLGDGVIRGGPGGDELWGGNGDDIIDPGNNRTSNNLDVDRGYDTVHGSMGDDMIIYSRSGEGAFQEIRYSDPDAGNYLNAGITATIDGATGRATVNKGSAGTDTIVDIAAPLNAGGFDLRGTGFGDVFNLTLDDGQFMNITAAAGNDRFNVRLIDDTSWVRLDYETAPAGINADLNAGRVSNDGHGNVDTFTGDIPKEIAGSEHSDVIRGSDRNEWFFGRRGNDNIDGRGGSDMLYFGYTSRFAPYVAVENLAVDLDAGTATGTWNGSAFSYSISNIERIRGGSGDDTIRGKIRQLRGSPGNDRIVFTMTENDDIYGEVTYYQLATGGITATLSGSAGRITVNKGSGGNDTIENLAGLLDWDLGGFGFYGTNSNDVFNLTLADEQWMQVGGGRGNDTFNIQANLDSGHEVRLDYRTAQQGIDIDLQAGRASNDGFGDVDTINGNVYQVRGSDHSDMIRGSNNNEHFIGRSGNDYIDGRGGLDTLRMDRDCCATVRSLEVDLGAGTATGTWNGEGFHYRLQNIEAVRGANGSDTFSGSARDERFRGKGGDDVFIFEGAHGHDRIEDFTNGDDVIVLLGLNITKQQVLSNASAWTEGTGVHINLTGFGGGRIDLHGFHRGNLDASDFLL